MFRQKLILLRLISTSNAFKFPKTFLGIFFFGVNFLSQQ